MEVLWVGQICDGPNVLEAGDIRGGIVQAPYATAERAGLLIARAGLKNHSTAWTRSYRKLHWQAVRQRVEFKLTFLMF